MVLKATIDDVTPRGWITLGYQFTYCAQINVTAADAITTIDTYEVDVSTLAFVNADHSDRRVLYYDGLTFEEIDSDIRDIGMGLRLYFAAQKNLGAGASDTTSYWLFWNSTTAVATKTNRDNIYLFYHECGDKVNWNDYFCVFNVVGGEFVATGAWFGRTLNTTDVGATDVVVYGKANVGVANRYAGIGLRSDAVANTGWTVILDPAGNLIRGQHWTGAGQDPGGGFAAYVCVSGADYIIKCKVVGNNYDAWASPRGTPIAGAALLSWINATSAANRNVGFVAHAAGNSTFDDIYVIHAVTNEPTVTLGATEDVSDFIGMNINGELQEPSKMIATITEIEGIRGVLSE